MDLPQAQSTSVGASTQASQEQVMKGFVIYTSTQYKILVINK